MVPRNPVMTPVPHPRPRLSRAGCRRVSCCGRVDGPAKSMRSGSIKLVRSPYLEDPLWYSRLPMPSKFVRLGGGGILWMIYSIGRMSKGVKRK